MSRVFEGSFSYSRSFGYGADATEGATGKVVAGLHAAVSHLEHKRLHWNLLRRIRERERVQRFRVLALDTTIDFHLFLNRANGRFNLRSLRGFRLGTDKGRYD